MKSAQDQERILRNITQAMNGQHDLPAMALVILEGVVDLIEAPVAAILLYRQEEHELELVAASGLAIPAGTRYLIDDALAGRVVKTLEPEIIGLDQRDELDYSQMKELNLTSVVQVPILFNGRLLGVLYGAQVGEPYHSFTYQDVRCMVLLAGYAGSVMANADLRVQVRNRGNQLKALYGQLAQMQEEERQYLARELHDEIGQTITHLKLTLNQLGRSTSADTREYLDEARSTIDQIIVQIRTLAHRNRPVSLNLGLLPALSSLFQQYSTKMQLHVEFEEQGLDRRFDPEIEMAVYRIAQEALTNAVRHAQVDQVMVRARATEETLTLEIEDDGAGFEPQSAIAGETLGLRSMHDRATQLGGELSVRATPGKGTSVLARLPLDCGSCNR